MADAREAAKAEAERRWPEWRHLRDSWDAVAMQAAFKQGAAWAWKARGEADAEAALRQIQLSSMVAVRATDFEKGVLTASAAIRALDEEGQ